MVGLPDAEWGEIVCAFVVRRDGSELDAASIDEHCRDLIAGYKLPRALEFVDALPRNNTGKVDKAEMRRIYQDRNGVDVAAAENAVTAGYS